MKRKAILFLAILALSISPIYSITNRFKSISHAGGDWFSVCAVYPLSEKAKFYLLNTDGTFLTDKQGKRISSLGCNIKFNDANHAVVGGGSKGVHKDRLIDMSGSYLTGYYDYIRYLGHGWYALQNVSPYASFYLWDSNANPKGLPVNSKRISGRCMSDKEMLGDLSLGGLVLVQKEKAGKVSYGYVDTSGTLVIPFKSYENALDFSDGMAAVQIDGLWGFIDSTGKLAIPAEFQDEEYDDDGSPTWHFRNGKAIMKDGVRYAEIDKDGEIIRKLDDRWGEESASALVYDTVSDSKSYYENGLKNVKTGKIVIPMRYGRIYPSYVYEGQLPMPTYFLAQNGQWGGWMVGGRHR